MRHWPLVVSLIVGAAQWLAAQQQTAPFNDRGVSFGHVTLTVPDVEAEQQFFKSLGASSRTDDPAALDFPGMFLTVRRADGPRAGSAGSVIEHIGFRVADLAGSLARWRAAGLTIEPSSSSDRLVLIAPNEVRVEVQEDRMQRVPIRAEHIHLQSPAPREMQAWYANRFGAVPARRGEQLAADLPGVFLALTEKPGVAPSKGRALDHIGFEVVHLKELCEALETGGITFDQPYYLSDGGRLAVAFLIDPWGTRIELIERLSTSTAK